MDRQFCKICRYSGFNNNSNYWTGCTYLIDTDEQRKCIGDWCLSFEYAPAGRSGRIRARRTDLRAEYRRRTEELTGRGAAKRQHKEPKKQTDVQPISSDDGFRIWFNVMMG